MPLPPLTFPELTELEQARAWAREVCVNPPLVRSRGELGTRSARTSERGAAPVWLKPETLQPIGSFKLRGIYSAVRSMTEEQRARGLLTVSAGNTAQALAWCGRYFGVPAASLMPEGAPRTKIDAVRRLGGTARLVPTDELFAFLREGGWQHESASFVHPWIDPRVIAGHASLGLELLDALDQGIQTYDQDPAAGEKSSAVCEIYVSVGGGGLIAGVAAALRAREVGNRVRLVAVEPSGCPALHAALRAGHPVDVECETFCDGVAVPYITEEMFPLLESAVDEVILVDDQDTRAALRELAFADRLIVEGSAALTYAAACASQSQLARICVLSGGSIDRTKLLAILSEEGRA